MRYFRFFMAILASFCAFFAYIARLNLSLTINRMVPLECLGSKNLFPANKSVNLPVSEKTMPFIYTIEHTYAFLSRPDTTNSMSYYWGAPQVKTNKSRRTSWSNRLSVAPLAIDVSDPSKSTNLDTNIQDDVRETPKECLLNWDEEKRNDLLGSFFYGYAMSQIIAARAAEVFGAKPLFLFVGFGATFCSLLFPLAAKYQESMVFAFAIRVFLGITQGALFPAVYIFFCQWLPKNERPNWLPYPSALSRVGTIVMNLLVPIILKKFTWEAVFYFTGGAALMWCIIFTTFASSRPQHSYWLSNEELVYIENNMEPDEIKLANDKAAISASGFTINESATKTPKKPPINWLKLCTNKAVLVLSLVMFTAEWSNNILLIKLPGYLELAFGMKTREIGLWSSVMIAIFCVTYPFAGWAANKLDNCQIEWLTPLRVRKLFESVANILQALGCILIAYCPNKAVVLGSLFLMMVGRSIVSGGQVLMPPELTKDYPGTVFAYANTIANLAGILAPKSITWMVSNPTEPSSWFGFFLMSAGIFIFGGMVFIIYADNKPHNYSKKAKNLCSNCSMSQAQLYKGGPEEIFKMQAFPKLATEKPIL